MIPFAVKPVEREKKKKMNLRIDAKLLLADVILVVGFFDVVDAFAAADVVLVCV